MAQSRPQSLPAQLEYALPRSRSSLPDSSATHRTHEIEHSLTLAAQVWLGPCAPPCPPWGRSAAPKSDSSPAPQHTLSPRRSQRPTSDSAALPLLQSSRKTYRTADPAPP